MNKKNNLLILVLFTLGILIIACNKQDDIKMEPVPVEANVKFNFSHSIGPDELEFTSIKYTNAFGNSYSVETLKYFISYAYT